MSKSPTITDDDIWSDNPEDWLPNPNAGEMLQSEFLEPLGLSPADLAQAIGVPADRVTDVVQGHAPMDAELDLRLGRYFRMNEGFFLGLQADSELLEQRRMLGSALDRIIPRAA